MPDANEYLEMAKERLESAKIVSDNSLRIELIDHALAYLRLAEQARKNQTLDLTYETPDKPAHGAQQQQQIQPKKEPGN